jgi:anti-repressor protein
MKQEIGIVKMNSGESAVSAKELYLYLGLDKSQWSRWYQKNIIDNDFVSEGIDYEAFDIRSSSNNGIATKDFVITIDFAKRISMMAKTERGESIRSYFIECEKMAITQQVPSYQVIDPIERAKAWILEQEAAKKQLDVANEKIQQDKPKVVFAESVIGSSNSILVRQFAKDLCDNNFEIGQNRLFEWFRENKYLNDQNEPFQCFVSQGLFEVITRAIGSGTETFTTKTTKITGKGSVYFANKIKSI